MPLTAQILRLTIPQLNFQMPANQNSLALEAPAYYQQLNHGSAVTIQNTSPEGVRVTLKAKDTDAKYTFNLAPCGGCRYYNTSQDLPEQCDPGPTYTLALPAGAYLATMNYDGQTRTESGEWHLAEGWEHFGCYYSLYNDRK